MKNRQSNLFLIALLVILLFLLYSLFSGDSELAIVQAKLKKANYSLDSITTELASASERISLLKSNVEKNMIEINALETERDSLNELYLLKVKESEIALDELKKKEAVLSYRIEELRRKNELFE